MKGDHRITNLTEVEAETIATAGMRRIHKASECIDTLQSVDAKGGTKTGAWK